MLRRLVAIVPRCTPLAPNYTTTVAHVDPPPWPKLGPNGGARGPLVAVQCHIPISLAALNAIARTGTK